MKPITELRQLFVDELFPIYPKDEILSIFYILLDYFDKRKRIDIAINPLIVVDETNYFKALLKLKEHCPVQYITNTQIFYGLTFKVTPDVLIPRPETEALVDWIVSDNKNTKKIKILDIGTGSGAIAISLAKNLNADVTAIDISEKVLSIAKENARILRVDVRFEKADVFSIDSLETNYDIIVSNPPYVFESEKKTIHNNVLLHEPHQALFVPDNNPLIFYEKIIKLFKKIDNKNKQLYFEIHSNTEAEFIKLLYKLGCKNYLFKRDFNEKLRMLKIRL